MAMVNVPEGGDVTIRAGGPDAGPAYVLRSLGGSDQVACATRAEAEMMARSYAEHARVNVWLAVAPNEFTLLVRFRGSERRTFGSATDTLHPHPQCPRTARMEP